MIWLAIEKVGCLPDELLRRIDQQAADGQAAAGSQQLSELIAEFGLQHDEYEARRARDEQARDPTGHARAREPTWRRSR